MTSFRVRPKIQIKTEQATEKVIETINSELKTKKHGVKGGAFPTHVHLEVTGSLQHFWSPQLDLTMDNSNSEAVILKGRYGPRQNIWLMFMFGYIALGVALLFSFMFWISMLTLDKESIWGYLSAFFLILLVALYIIAQTGQKIGAEQMFIIHHFLEDSLKKPIEFV